MDKKGKKYLHDIFVKSQQDPPVMDLASEKKEELVEDIFGQKSQTQGKQGFKELGITNSPQILTISRFERAVLPVVSGLTVIVGVFFMLSLYVYGSIGVINREISNLFSPAISFAKQSVSFLGDDLNSLTEISVKYYLAGVNFLGDEVADLAIMGADRTLPLIK